jgi:hypothetical protein
MCIEKDFPHLFSMFFHGGMCKGTLAAFIFLTAHTPSLFYFLIAENFGFLIGK